MALVCIQHIMKENLLLPKNLLKFKKIKSTGIQQLFQKMFIVMF